MTKEILKKIILKWIQDNFGSSEANDPCYNIDMLSEYIVEEMNKYGNKTSS